MNEKLISPFYDDHLQINQLLRDFRKNLQVNALTNQSLQKIRWALERHFYLEEKFLYNLIISVPTPPFPKILRVIKEHDIFLKNMGTIESLLRNLPDSMEELHKEFNQFENKIYRHVKYEVSNIYELFASITFSDQSNHIIQELQKRITLGFYPLEKMRVILMQELTSQMETTD